MRTAPETNGGNITFSQSENRPNTIPQMMAATMQAPMYPPNPACGMMSNAGEMNTKLPTKPIGMRAPSGPTPKLWMMVHTPQTNSEHMMSRPVSAVLRPKPPAIRIGAGNVENMKISIC